MRCYYRLGCRAKQEGRSVGCRLRLSRFQIRGHAEVAVTPGVAAAMIAPEPGLVDEGLVGQRVRQVQSLGHDIAQMLIVQLRITEDFKFPSRVGRHCTPPVAYGCPLFGAIRRFGSRVLNSISTCIRRRDRKIIKGGTMTLE